MRVQHRTDPLPRCWGPLARGCVLEADISIRRSSRLRAKLLIFGSRGQLWRFWKQGLGRDDLGPEALGCVNSMGYESIRRLPSGQIQQALRVDPRYFCVIGMVRGHLNMEIVVHESVHAAFAYAKRVHRRDLWVDAASNDEETVCYPAGIIAKRINALLHRHGLYAPAN